MAFEFFKRFLGGGKEQTQTVTADEFFGLYSDTYIRELAFQACVSFTANALSKCEFKTFTGGKELKGNEYYLWNVEPNQNQNSSVFLHKLVHHLYRDNEALVIENAGRLYVADSYDRKEYALYDDIFRQVTVGDFTFNRSFAASDVLFFQLNDENVTRVIRGLYESYRKLLAYGMNAYQKSRGTKGTLEVDMAASGNKEYKERYNAIRNEEFRKFVNEDNSVLPLYKGMKFTELAHKTYSGDTTRDIRSMIDDVTDFTARCFGIPPPLLNGSVQDVSSATDQALTFCIDPLADNIQKEITRKRYGRSGYLRGNYLRIDTSSMKHIDLLDVSAGVDKLISSGVVCVNDLRGLLGLPLIMEPWAWEHFMTKNYAAVAELLRLMEGGETARAK